MSLNRILSQEGSTTVNHLWQIALINGKREAMGLGEVVRGNGNDHGHVPQSFSREFDRQFRLHTWLSGFTLERGMDGFDTSQELRYFRHVQYGTGDPDTGSWGTTMYGHVEPIAVPVIVSHGKLPTMHPEA